MATLMATQVRMHPAALTTDPACPMLTGVAASDSMGVFRLDVLGVALLPEGATAVMARKADDEDDDEFEDDDVFFGDDEDDEDEEFVDDEFFDDEDDLNDKDDDDDDDDDL